MFCVSFSNESWNAASLQFTKVPTVPTLYSNTVRQYLQILYFNKMKMNDNVMAMTCLIYIHEWKFQEISDDRM